MPQQYIQRDRETIYEWINFIESIKQLKGISVKNFVSSRVLLRYVKRILKLAVKKQRKRYRKF